MEIQTDTVSEAARVLLPLIARDLWYSGEPAASGSAERRRQVALERLADWNGEMSEHRPEPLIYAAWVRALQRRLVQDELGPLQQLVPAPDPVFIERVYRDVDGAVGLVRRAADHGAGELRRDGAALARRRADRARGALRGAAGELALGGRAPGAAPAPDARARAGAAASRQHPPEHAGRRPDAPARGRCRGRGRSPISTCTPRGSAAVYDFSDPDSSVFVIATGESGHLLSRHYDDLAAIWRRSEYIPMSLDPGLARAGAIGVTRLRPAAGGQAPDAGLSG